MKVAEAAQADAGRRGRTPCTPPTSTGDEHPVRRRAGHAARHRPRHLPVRHLEQLRGRQRRRRRGRRARTCCTTSSASPRPTPRAWAAARSRPNSTGHPGHRGPPPVVRGPGARHRDRPSAPLRLARRALLKRSVHHQRHLGPVHHQARRAGRPAEINVCVGYDARRQADRHPAAGRRRDRGLHSPSTRCSRAGPKERSASREWDELPAERAPPTCERVRGAHRRADRHGVHRPRPRAAPSSPAPPVSRA